jgi:hypothetical protein
MAAVASSAFALALFAVFAASAAAVVPGTPDPVAPGVPGHGRAWELVTPPDVTPERLFAGIGRLPLVAVSTAGDRVVYETDNASPGASYGGIFATALAERRADGWVDTPLELPYPELASLSFVFTRLEGAQTFDPELRTSIWTNRIPGPGSGVGLFRRTADGTYSSLGRIGKANEEEIEAEFSGASDDLQRVFFMSYDHLLPADAARTQGESVYEIFNSELNLVDVNDDGSLVSNCGSRAGRENSEYRFNGQRYSSDGQRVFFESNPACGQYERVYLRAGGHTTEISASQCTLPDPECGPEQDVSFVSATADGSVAYIATAQRLTNDDSNAYQDLYRYDVASGELTLLTPRSAGSTASPTDFGILYPVNGSSVYFTASGQLIPGQGTAEKGLYLADGQGLHFIAALAGSLRYNVVSKYYQVTADGRQAFFATPEQLASGDTDTSADVYRYDAATGDYLEVSAGQGGSGSGAFEANLAEGPLAGPGAFFTTEESLVPEDRNTEEDVYEWTQAGGLGLVSAGAPGFAGQYLGGTDDGRTVLFRTQATLVPRDRDGGELDIYAARVGGGFPEPLGQADCGEGGVCEAAGAGTPHRVLPPADAGKPFIGLAPLDAGARRQLARKGAITLLLEVPRAGRLTAEGQARIGSHLRRAAVGGAVAKAAGPLRLRLRLTKVARRSLTHGHDLRVRLLVRLSGQQATAKDSFALRAAR